MAKKKIVLTRAQAQRQEAREFAARVLDLFYGPKKLTQAEIAREERCSRQRVHQIIRYENPEPAA